MNEQQHTDRTAGTRPDPWGRLGSCISRVALEPRYWLLPLLCWALLVGGSLWWNWRGLERHSLDTLAQQARQIASMTEAVRSWNAGHDGVFVRGGRAFNPYLEGNDPALGADDGSRLVRLTPAAQTRELAAIVQQLTEVEIRQASLEPINPDNRADAWETAALHGFATDLGERMELLATGPAPSFRYIRPLVLEPACLQCHVHGARGVGDVRGGLSVTLAAAPLLALERRQKANVVVFHAIAWLLLAGGTVLVLARLRYQVESLQAARMVQDQLVEVRTRELRQQVSERQQAEERLRLLIDSSAEGILAVDRAGLCTLCNPVAARLLGYLPEELLGQPLRDLIAHSEPDGGVRRLRNCPLLGAYRYGREGEDLDTVFWREDGRPLPVEYRAQPIRTADGHLGAVITFLDIRERRLLEAQRRALHTGIEQSTTAIAILGHHGVIEYVNPAFCTLSGFAAEALQGRPIDVLYCADNSREAYQEVWRTVLGGDTWEGVLASRKADGTLFWVRVSMSPVDSGRGRYSHAVAICGALDEVAVEQRQEGR